MKDEYDYLDDPSPGKIPKDKPSWLLHLQEQVLYFILRETEDFVLKKEIASVLKSNEANVGACLADLVRKGILTPLREVPKNKEVFLEGIEYSWKDGKWFPKQVVFRAHKRIKVLSLDKPLKWDGRAYFIIRGEEFFKELKKRNLPSDPHASWSCPECGKMVQWDFLSCDNDKIVCRYRRPNHNYWPKTIKRKTCKNCGVIITPSKPHKLRHCNLEIVSKIMKS